MSTPADQFPQLTLESPDSSRHEQAPLENIGARAVQLQDTLSSFHAMELPSEFQPNVFHNIEYNLQMPSGIGSSHTISGNLPGTLLQWGAYNETAWECLSQLQTPRSCATLYCEKVQRRFDACFDAYDLLLDSPPSASMEVSLQRIIHEFFKLSKALSTDRERRQHMHAQSASFEARIVHTILQALQNTCQRGQSILAPSAEVSQRSSRGSAVGNRENLSLAGILIRQADEDQPFLLDALEQFSTPELRQSLESLASLDGFLTNAKAPAFYTVRFEALKRKANEEMRPILEGVGSGWGGGGRDREADMYVAPNSRPKRERHTGGR